MKSMLRKITILILALILPCKSWSQADFKVIFDDSPGEIVKVTPRVSSKDTFGITAINDPRTTVINDSLRASLVSNAKKYIGVRYKYSQSNENGFDCSGYVKYVYGKFRFHIAAFIL